MVADDPVERAARHLRLQEAEAAFEPLAFYAAAARTFGAAAASLRRSGRTSQARGFDALLASITISNELPVFTCNRAEFDGIDGLELVEMPRRDW